MHHLSLISLGDELQPETESSETGAARRIVKPGGAFQQVAIRLRAGGVLPEHDSPGDATLLVVEGAVRFNEVGSGSTHELRAGDLFAVPEARHSVEAEEESLLLLSYAIR